MKKLRRWWKLRKMRKVVTMVPELAEFYILVGVLVYNAVQQKRELFLEDAELFCEAAQRISESGQGPVVEA